MSLVIHELELGGVERPACGVESQRQAGDSQDYKGTWTVTGQHCAECLG